MEKINFEKRNRRKGRLRNKVGALILSGLASLSGSLKTSGESFDFKSPNTATKSVETNNNNIDPLGNEWRRAEGKVEVNWYIQELALAKREDTSMIQYALDHYSEWKNQWLSSYIAWLLGRRAQELENQLSESQKEQLTNVAVDFFREENFRLDKTCGIDPWNSCSEDFIGNAMKYSLRSLKIFEEAVRIVGGEKLKNLEEKYLKLALTDKNGNFSLVRQISPIDGKEHLVVLNHGMQNPPYAAKILIHLNNAFATHFEGGHLPPDFYYKSEIISNIKELFEWLQITTLPDGSAFLPSGCLNYKGENGPCNDPGFSESVPLFLPAGRIIENLFGKIETNGWSFLEGDPTYNGGDSWNQGRKLIYHDYGYNPPSLSGVLNLQASFEGLTLTIQWNLLPGISSYEIFGPNGLVGKVEGDESSYSFYNPPPGKFVFFVIPRTNNENFNRIKGIGTGIVDVPYMPRRHLKKGGS